MSAVATSRISNIADKKRRTLIGFMFVLSFVLWLDVSSNRDSILHAVGKLGIATRGYGTVNIALLTIALLWSFVSFCFAANISGVSLGKRLFSYFVLGVSFIVAVASLTGIVFDGWFATNVLSAIVVELLEFVAASWISWVIFFRPRRHLSDFAGAGLFGLLGLTTVTAIALLVCPGVGFRI